MAELNQLKAALQPAAAELRNNATYSDCGRCDGKGYINGYSHVKAGVCFACSGTKRKAANQAARNYAEMNRHYREIRRHWHMGIKRFDNSTNYRALLCLIGKLPKKYQALIGELPYTSKAA